ncbi:MAG: hypothetical protein LBP64_01830 [Tannerella sp.]|nr:hypothetical protein [Tannerella sp.]
MVSFFNHNSSTIVRGESFALPGDSDAIKDAHEKARAAVLPDSASSGSDTTAVATSGSNPAAVTKISTPSSSAGKENTPETKKAKSVTPVTPKSSTSSGKDVKARVKMTEGQRLTLLSLKYYGNKIFWVYIYEYNKSRIGANPNRIPVGMEILIPENRIYDIDAGNEASVRKAQKRQDEIISGLN